MFFAKVRHFPWHSSLPRLHNPFAGVAACTAQTAAVTAPAFRYGLSTSGFELDSKNREIHMREFFGVECVRYAANAIVFDGVQLRTLTERQLSVKHLKGNKWTAGQTIWIAAIDQMHAKNNTTHSLDTNYTNFAWSKHQPFVQLNEIIFTSYIQFYP